MISENEYSIESKYINTNFANIDFVITENYLTSSPFNNPNPNKYESVDTEYGDTFAAAVSLNKRILSFLNFGLSGYLPLPRIIYLDAVDPISPTYSAYRSNYLRPYLNFGIAFTKFEKIKFGKHCYGFT